VTVPTSLFAACSLLSARHSFNTSSPVTAAAAISATVLNRDADISPSQKIAAINSCSQYSNAIERLNSRSASSWAYILMLVTPPQRRQARFERVNLKATGSEALNRMLVYFWLGKKFVCFSNCLNIRTVFCFWILSMS
jgi:hypothetical protein